MIEVSEPEGGRPARLANARAEFIASLGPRLSALRNALQALEQDPRSPSRRDHLLRRVHALAAAAKVLGFASVAEALTQAEQVLHQLGSGDSARAELLEVARALDLVPELAGGAALSIRPGELSAGDRAAAPPWPNNVLVFGARSLADALRAGADGTLEVEVGENLAQSLDLARAMGPDAIVIDADHVDAREFAEGASADPLLDQVPFVVVGEFAAPRLASEYVVLGASRVLVKPVSPDVLRNTVLDVSQGTRARPELAELGELTVEALAERLASEVQRGLVSAVEAGREAPVAFGAGADVLGAVWGAVARVRELVTLHSSGVVRFARSGPEGAVPLAGWHAGSDARAERSAADARDAEGVSLRGRRILVVDDDPAVAWFIAGLLRAVGAEVLETHDGATAERIALETWPDVIITDVVMPELDGFALCRRVKRDVVLRDVPVILLSWKEDLLQRLREIGADANGYLRKEASASTVIQRVREVLRPRARVEQRLAVGGEVRGRLDGLTPRLVLELASRSEPNCRVSIRDASYLYEVQIREGRPLCLTRTAPDGSFSRGEPMLGPLLGVSAGRFTVTPDASHCRSDFNAPLSELLSEPIRRARVAQRALGEEKLLEVRGLELDQGELEAYARASVEPVRSLLGKLSAGASPRDLLLGGDVSPRVLEAVLTDLSRHGAVLSVEHERGHNVLQEAPPQLVELEPAQREYRTETPPPAFSLMFSPEPEPVAEAPQSAARENSAPDDSESAPLDLADAVLGTLSAVSAAPPVVAQRPSDEPVVESPPASPEEPLPETPRSARLEIPGRAKLAEAAKPADEPADSVAAPDAITPRSPRSRSASAPKAPAQDSPKDGSPWRVLAVTALAGVASYGVVRFVVTPRLAPAPSSVAVPAQSAPELPPPVVHSATPAVAPAPKSAEPAARPRPKAEELDLPEGVSLLKPKGLLEVDTGDKQAVYVDGAFVGRGPMRRVPLDPGQHSLELREGAQKDVYPVNIQTGRRTRLSFPADAKRAEGGDSL